MAKLLANLLAPIFTPLGVTMADLESNLNMCMGYIIGILIALVIMIVVIVLAKKAPQGTKAAVRITAVVAWLAVVTIIVNMLCFGPMRSNLATMMNASSFDMSEDTVTNSKNAIRMVGEEGLVLVKNDSLLPLSGVSAVNVFGWGSTSPIFGGTGSGSSDGSSAVGILESLANAGLSTNADLTKIYTDYCAVRPTTSMQAQDWTLPEPTVDVYTDAVMSQAKSFSDVAVIVICRSGGEGADLPTDMYAVIHGTYDVAPTASVGPDGGPNANYKYTNATYTNNGSYDDFEQGEHYLELSVTEENMVQKVCSEFDKVIVIVNANNAMELNWVDQYPQIGAVILAPGTGNTGMDPVGEIITGAVNPSGRTVDTYVKDLTATPTWNNFGNFSFTNVNDLKQQIATNDSAYEGNLAFLNYVEGIYVGYKFYETAHVEGMSGFSYDSVIQYPFGYGLSYTTFSQEIQNFSDSGDNITFDVAVKNTGSVAGKEVVEVYYTPPYTNGGIEKAAVNLIEIGKTKELAAGASETIKFSIPKENMASYDASGTGRYVLESGDYTISIRSDSHTVLDEETFSISSTIDYSSGRASDKIPAVNRFEDYSRGDFEQLSRRDKFANYASATAAPAASAYEMSAETRAIMEETAFGYYDGTKLNNSSDVAPTLGAKNGLVLSDLTGKAYDDPDWDKLLDQLSFDDMSNLINLGGWHTEEITSVGKVRTSDCDGPAGLSNFITGNYGTAYPSEVLMAQTWNKDLIYEMGSALGQEYADASNYGWYGPAMNTHRSAFAGRNFEYFSEDGVLAGLIATAEINGAATKGVYPYLKHFAVNDQETNRCSFLLTYASEQAIREIYLKPFEMCVKNYTGKALAVMSSFNFIGAIPSCSNPYLLNEVLRDEWGFVGMVKTDYNGSYGYMISDHCVRTGNDIMLGFGSAPSNQFNDQSATIQLAMRQSCKNILYTIGNSGYYVDATVEVGGMDNMTVTFIIIDVIVAIILIAIEAAAIITMLRKRKNAK